MAATASTDGAITPAEFKSVMERVTALEDSRSMARGATTDVGPEVVTQSEFRLFKWLATFALATVLGGLGLLYQQTSDLRVEMRVLHTDVLRELHAQINSVRGEISMLREEMHREIGGLREEIGGLREEMHKGQTKGTTAVAPSWTP